MEISALRSQIDAIDEKLADLFIQRMTVSAAIGTYKAEQNLPIFVPQREQEIIEQLTSRSPDALAPYVAGLYEKIFSLSREYQQELMKE